MARVRAYSISTGDIAAEKAGVVRSGGLAVTGETKPPALNVIRQVCRERGARLIEASHDVDTQVTWHDGLTELVMTTPRRRYAERCGGRADPGSETAAAEIPWPIPQ